MTHTFYNSKTPTHLPFLDSLKLYPENNWACIFHLTMRRGTFSLLEMEDQAYKLMDTLAFWQNATARELHYFIRMERGHGKYASRSGMNRLHMHGCIGTHLFAKGPHFEFSKKVAAIRMWDTWNHQMNWNETTKVNGNAQVFPYIPNYDGTPFAGVSYTMKCETSDSYEDRVIISEGLMKDLTDRANEQPLFRKAA